jgi:hypothetical protein
MTEREIREIEDRCKLTTPGPWKSIVEGRDMDSGDSFIMTGISEGEDIWSSKRGEDIYLTGVTTADQDFIAHARQDIPKLIAEIKRLNSK